MDNSKVVWKAKTAAGVEVTIKNDKYHYRAFDGKGEIVGEPFIHLEDLLTGIQAELTVGQGELGGPDAHDAPEAGGAELHGDGEQGAGEPAGGAEIHAEARDELGAMVAHPAEGPAEEVKNSKPEKYKPPRQSRH